MSDLKQDDDELAAWREQLTIDALASYEHYKRTGLHVTHEEMKAWMKKLEAGEECEPPKCHT